MKKPNVHISQTIGQPDVYNVYHGTRFIANASDGTLATGIEFGYRIAMTGLEAFEELLAVSERVYRQVKDDPTTNVSSPTQVRFQKAIQQAKVILGVDQ